jgi:hypothetical protein
MDRSWHETNVLLDSISQEYNAILQELAASTDYQHGIRLRAWASVCVADYQETMQRYHTANQHKTSLSP